jgi:hypothetical protein
MSGDSTCAFSRASLFAWQVSADQEEPWRRFLQELSGSRHEEYAESRRRRNISAESVWFASMPSGGGIAIVCLEAEDLERALRELAESEIHFDTRYEAQMRKLFGCDFARLPRVASSERFSLGGRGGDGGAIVSGVARRPLCQRQDS